MGLPKPPTLLCPQPPSAPSPLLLFFPFFFPFPACTSTCRPHPQLKPEGGALEVSEGMAPFLSLHRDSWS